MKALPFEMIIIGGAAVGAFAIANDGPAIKNTLIDIGKVFKGVKWKADDYRDLLCLLFELIRLVRQNPVALEEHIEDPKTHRFFQKYPKILQDHEAVELICDTMRSASMNYETRIKSKRCWKNGWMRACTMRCIPVTPCSRWPMRCRLLALSPLCWG